MIYTTLNEIRGFVPCGQEKGCGYGFDKLLSHLGKTEADDEPLPLVTVLDSNGLNDTIWCLRVCPDVAAEFAQWCAGRASAMADAGWTKDAAAEAADSVDLSNALAAALASFRATKAATRSAAMSGDWAAEAADYEAERQAQADKLRELLS